MRIDVRVALAGNEMPRGPQRRNHVVGHVVGIAPGELAEALDENRAFVERRKERKVVLFAELLVLRAATRRDMNQARAFGFADFAPGDDAVRFGGRAAGSGHSVREDTSGNVLRGKVVEGTLVGKAEQVPPGKLFQNFDASAALQ